MGSPLRVPGIVGRVPLEPPGLWEEGPLRAPGTVGGVYPLQVVWNVWT